MRALCYLCQILIVLIHTSLYSAAIFLRLIDKWEMHNVIWALSITAVYSIIFLVCEKFKNEAKVLSQEEIEIKGFEKYLETL